MLISNKWVSENDSSLDILLYIYIYIYVCMYVCMYNWKEPLFIIIIIIPLYPNLFVYVCKALSWRVEPWSLPLNPQ